MCQRDFAIEIFGEGFEVDIGGIDVIVDVVEGFAGDVAVGDHDGFQAEGTSCFADVDHIFPPDGGFVIGEGERGAFVSASKEGNFFGRDMPGMNLVVMRLGDIPVLTKEATHVATGGAQAEDARAGKKVIERLLFDGIDLKRGGRGIAETVQLSVLVDSDVAETGLAWANVAMAGAEVTVNAIVRFGIPPEGFV